MGRRRAGLRRISIGRAQAMRAQSGKILKLIAHDRGAAVDLQAFYNMTGDALLAVDAVTQIYWLRGRQA